MSRIDAYPLVSRGHSTHPATAASGLYASHSTPINKPAYHSRSYSTPDAYFPQADAKSTPHRNRDKDAVGGSNRQYYAGRTWHGVQQLSPTNHLSAASNYYGTSSHLLAVPPTTGPHYTATQTSPPPSSPVHRSSRSRSRAPQYSRAPSSPAIPTSSQPSPGYHRHRTALAPTLHSPHASHSRNTRTKDYTITHSSTRSKGLGLFASRALKPGDSIPIHQDEEADAARLNHSCSPNTRYIPIPISSSPSPALPSSLLIPLRPIRTNEELTVSYLPTDILLLPHTSRRRWVWEHFGFECLCTRCVAGSSSSGRGENKNKNKNKKEKEKEKETMRSRRSRRESDEARKWLAWFLTGGVESSESSESAERSGGANELPRPPPPPSFEEWCFSASASADDGGSDDELALISLHLHALDLVEREGLEVLGKARHLEAVVMCYGALGEAWAGEFREWVWRMLLERRREDRGGSGDGAGMLIRDESEKAFMLWLSNPVTFPLWGLKLKAKRRPGAVKPAAGCRKW